MVPAEHHDPDLLPIERANVDKLFADLVQAGVLVSTAQRASQDAVTAALLGRLTSPYPGASTLEDREVVFLSDSAAATRTRRPSGHRDAAAADHAARRRRVRLLHESDLTTRIDGYQTEGVVHRLRAALGDAAAVVTCLQRPVLPMLRNLNRVLEGLDKPWVNAFIDGPFITVAGLKSPHTGCFECFEQRALARLEDHVIYHEFAREPDRAGRRRGTPTRR